VRMILAAAAIAAATATAAYAETPIYKNAANATDPNAIQLQFQAVNGSRSTQAAWVQVSIKNTTDTDIALILWSCDVRYQGHLVGRDDPVTFVNVPKKTIATNNQWLAANGGMFDQVSCNFVVKEDMTKETEEIAGVGWRNHTGDQLIETLNDADAVWRKDGAIHGNLGNLIPNKGK
jgi:hypothetical protein